MDVAYVFKGLLIGFAMAVPPGPLGALSVSRTLTEGRSQGLIVGLGAASVDALYAGIAAFGLTIVTDVIHHHQLWIRLFVGVLLLILGIRMLRTRRSETLVLFDAKGFWGIYVSSFLIGVTNPLSIFAFLAVFAACGLVPLLSASAATMLVIGVFAGSALWFLTLGVVTTLFHNRLAAGGLGRVNRLAGALVIVSGIMMFAGVI